MQLQLLACASLLFVLSACSSHTTPDGSDPAMAGTSAAAVLARAQAIADAGRLHPSSARHESPPVPAIAGLGKADADGYAELDWMQMLPKSDLDLLDTAPPVVHIGTRPGKQNGTLHTIAALDGRKVRLPGYVVPLESDSNGQMNEFFFVPFYGACIHVPPPPPNMMVHVILSHGIETPSLWDPYWLKGTLRIETTRNSMASSAYGMEGARIERYTDNHQQALQDAFE